MGLPDTRISGLRLAPTPSRLSDKQVAVYAVDYPATRDFMKAVDARARSDHRTRRRCIRFCPTAVGQRCQSCSRSCSFRQSIESIGSAPDGLEPGLRRYDYRPVQRR
jgi:hypothetical protein